MGFFFEGRWDRAPFFHTWIQLKERVLACMTIKLTPFCGSLALQYSAVRAFPTFIAFPLHFFQKNILSRIASHTCTISFLKICVDYQVLITVWYLQVYCNSVLLSCSNFTYFQYSTVIATIILNTNAPWNGEIGLQTAMKTCPICLLLPVVCLHCPSQITVAISTRKRAKLSENIHCTEQKLTPFPPPPRVSFQPLASLPLSPPFSA